MATDFLTGQRLTADLLNDTIADYTINRPIVRLVASGTQALADNTQTAITFSTEEIDTHGFHSTAVNTSRITPTIAGYYRFSGTVWFAALTTPVRTVAFLRQNGASNLAATQEDAASTRVHSRSITLIVSMNGTTDYMELCGLQDSAGANTTNQSGGSSSVFECEFLRPL